MIIFIILSITSCNKDSDFTESRETREYSPDHLYGFYDQLCILFKSTPGFFPPQVARAYGYIGLTNYESVVHGIKGGISLQHQLNGFSAVTLPQPESGQVYNWAISSNAAVAKMTRYMFEKRLSTLFSNKIDSVELTNHILLSFGENQNIIDRSQAYGYLVADAIFEYSKTDGGHESYLEPFQLPYNLPTDEYCWVPTSAITTPLSPKWGDNRPFMTVNITHTNPGPPVSFSTDTLSEFFAQAIAVYNQLKNNTQNQIEIAQYWSDDPGKTCTPAGHTFNILMQILKDERVTLAKASVGIAKMSIAENDVFIACWKSKYEYLLLRPVTYIKRYIDPSFTTVLGSPPFPAYTSGHSCEIGAGARIMSHLFTNGSGDYLFTDYSQLQHGFTARSYSNFDEMAEECADSRLYGGIHYPMDNSKGLQTGRAVGDNINKLLQWPVFIQ